MALLTTLNDEETRNSPANRSIGLALRHSLIVRPYLHTEGLRGFSIG
jgi:hypothetical protein